MTGSPQPAGCGITATITLTGTAALAGTHTVGLSSATLTALGAAITASPSVTKIITAGAGTGGTGAVGAGGAGKSGAVRLAGYRAQVKVCPDNVVTNTIRLIV